jgi:hypothetical protein
MFKREWFEQLPARWENLRARTETSWREYAEQPDDVKLKLLAVLLFIVAIVMGSRHRRA